MFFYSENALLNRNLFNRFLNERRQSVARVASGRLFQRRRAARENAYSPCVRSLHHGTSSRQASGGA